MAPTTITDLWLSSDNWLPGQANPDDDSVDVVVTLNDGSTWAGTFATFRHVSTLRSRWAESGECLGGKYLWMASLVLVDRVDRPSIQEVVADLLASGELTSALQPESGVSANPSLQRTPPG